MHVVINVIRLSYFAAQEIPAALVTFVSLLIFIQTGTSPALSTMYSALLSLPWVAKVWMGWYVQHRQHLRRSLMAAELLMVVWLFLLSLILSPSTGLLSFFGIGLGNGKAIFALLFLLSLTTAWHETVADTKYHQVLRPSLRRIYDTPRMLLSQTMVVLTYGLLIVLVGTLEVTSRSILVSWTAACRITAGAVLLFFLWHAASALLTRDELHRPVTHKAPSYAPHLTPKRVLLCFLLLLPQSLMFYTRVFYLLTPRAEGGLSRSLQEVGFAHGVSGALAFSIGLMLSQWVVARRPLSDMRHVLYNPVLFSPVIYLLMTYFPPASLWQLCVCTFLAQLFFGYGLHRALSQVRLSAMNGLHMPVVALAMLVPVAFSGWLFQQVDIQTFFWIDALTALLPIGYVLLSNPFPKLTKA